jgi:predicted alpha/beta superfamily hydrolase
LSPIHALTGNFRFHPAFPSRFLREPRNLIVYLPPGYDSSPGVRYPVLYMHDGQNLFDAETSFAGTEWGLDETAEELIRAGQMQPVIIVGIYNTGTQRLPEYTPFKDRRGRGGRAWLYGKLIVQDLKPFIDENYRTLPGPENTGLGGSSLGGLVSLSLGLHYPALFGKLLVMSPSVWWANRAILRQVGTFGQQHPQEVRPKIWLDIGTEEDQKPDIHVDNVTDLRDALCGQGWEPGQNLQFLVDEGAGHNEAAWGHRARTALPFLFPPVGLPS